MVGYSSWRRRGGYLLAALIVAALGLGCSSSSNTAGAEGDLLPTVTGSSTYRATDVNGAGFTAATIDVVVIDLQAATRAQTISQVSGRITSSDGQFNNTEIAVGGLQLNRVIGLATAANSLTYRITIDLLDAGAQCRLALENSTAGNVTVFGTAVAAGGGDTVGGGGDPDNQPRLALSTTALNLPNGTNSGTVDISNSGTGTLTWTATTSDSFLSVDAASGEGDATLTITADRTGLASGTHTGQVTVDSNGGRLTVVVSVVVP